ncbi:MFS transporter [Marinomonas spartinae]|uniref:MFS transporter n=1 Tax=Marinomonas spartinae TaxID=1792290 RepID=UPI0018F20C4A|nr:MFS transporter [Marinomonas spartinae]MBJ7556783.1 MFS transporter [Marinomonas spartinae]
MEKNLEIDVNNVPFKNRIGYGAGDFASNLIFTGFSFFLVYFYTDIINIPAAIVGTIMLVSRLFDGVTDIIMGVIVDRTKSRFGKARPWLLWMAVPFGVSAALVFFVPESNNLTLQVAYIFITYNLVSLFYTAINIPYGVLNSLITNNPYQRSLLNIARAFMANVGVIVVGQLVMPLVGFLGGGKEGWQYAFIILSIISTLLFLITFLSSKENVQPHNAQQHELKPALGALVRNRYWWLALLFGILLFVIMGLTFNSPVYYGKYILKDPSSIGTLIMCLIIPQFPTLFIMPKIVKRWGKRLTCQFGLICLAISYLLIQIDPYNMDLVFASNIIKGIGLAPLIGSFFAILADTVEYGEWKTGLRTEGLVYSAGSFGSKVGIGLGTAMVGWILGIGGYVGSSAAQPESALNAILSVSIYYPLIITVLTFIVLCFYKLDKIFPKILADLDSEKMGS